MRFKKQTQQQKIAQIGKVQFEMWMAVKKMGKEIGVLQERLGIGVDEEE